MISYSLIPQSYSVLIHIRVVRGVSRSEMSIACSFVRVISIKIFVIEVTFMVESKPGP